MTTSDRSSDREGHPDGQESERKQAGQEESEEHAHGLGGEHQAPPLEPVGNDAANEGEN